MYYPVCGMVHIKEPLLLIERVAHVTAAGFLSRYLNGPLPYVQCHIKTIFKNVLSMFPSFLFLCSFMVRASAYGAMSLRIDPSKWTHWSISCSSQCSTTGVTKVKCYPVSVMVFIFLKDPLLLIKKSNPYSSSLATDPLPYARHHIPLNKMCWVYC